MPGKYLAHPLSSGRVHDRELLLSAPTTENFSFHACQKNQSHKMMIPFARIHGGPTGNGSTAWGWIDRNHTQRHDLGMRGSGASATSGPQRNQ